MSQSNHYSLASPTSLLLDDNQIIERVFSHIDNKTTDLGSEVWKEPVQNYLDQERFNKEIKLLRSLPVPFCPSSALPEKGSYVSRIAAGTPILVTRDEEDNVNAFINACRHRGMQVASGSGCKKSFVCPYHGWTYGLKGENRNIPGSDGFPGIDLCQENHRIQECFYSPLSNHKSNHDKDKQMIFYNHFRKQLACLCVCKH